MTQTIAVSTTGRRLPKLPGRERFGRGPLGHRAGLCAADGFSPPERSTPLGAQRRALRRRRGLERIDRILAELLAIYQIHSDLDSAACVEAAKPVPALVCTQSVAAVKSDCAACADAR